MCVQVYDNGLWYRSIFSTKKKLMINYFSHPPRRQRRQKRIREWNKRKSLFSSTLAPGWKGIEPQIDYVGVSREVISELHLTAFSFPENCRCYFWRSKMNSNGGCRILNVRSFSTLTGSIQSLHVKLLPCFPDCGFVNVPILSTHFTLVMTRIYRLGKCKSWAPEGDKTFPRQTGNPDEPPPNNSTGMIYEEHKGS